RTGLERVTSVIRQVEEGLHHLAETAKAQRQLQQQSQTPPRDVPTLVRIQATVENQMLFAEKQHARLEALREGLRGLGLDADSRRTPKAHADGPRSSDKPSPGAPKGLGLTSAVRA